MKNTDPRIDTYIAQSPEFARPIMEHLRALVHNGCPDVVETIKWGVPHFDYKGILCSMAAFKAHAVFGFWRASMMDDPHNLLAAAPEKAMGNLGRITTVKDLPPARVLIAYVKEAVRVADEGRKPVARARTEPREEAGAPEYLARALAKNRKAQKAFAGFSPSKRREYIEWLNEAKTEATRVKRLATAVEWIAEGKGRNWKYERK